MYYVVISEEKETFCVEYTAVGEYGKSAKMEKAANINCKHLVSHEGCAKNEEKQTAVDGAVICCVDISSNKYVHRIEAST